MGFNQTQKQNSNQPFQKSLTIFRWREEDSPYANEQRALKMGYIEKEWIEYVRDGKPLKKMSYRNYGYGRRSYGRNYGNNTNGNYQRKAKKRTSCKKREVKGKTVYFGWKVARGQLIKFVASIYSKGKPTQKNGKTWVPWVAKITNVTTGQSSLSNCIMHQEAGKLYFPDMQCVANPNRNYWGTCKVRN